MAQGHSTTLWPCNSTVGPATEQGDWIYRPTWPAGLDWSIVWFPRNMSPRHRQTARLQEGMMAAVQVSIRPT